MSKFTKDDILAMENPYNWLIDKYNLAENLDVFDELSVIEKRELAARIILKCPYEKHSGLVHEISERLENEKDTESFPGIIKEALHVNKLLDVLRAGTPADFFNNTEHDQQLFFDFPSLVAARLQNNEIHIASRLASEPVMHRTINHCLFKLSYASEEPTPFFSVYNHFRSNILLSDEITQPLQGSVVGNQHSNEEVNFFRFYQASSATHTTEDSRSQHRMRT